MTDLHTHILPGMDDGAEDVKTALEMLDAIFRQGVKTVALTPHFYRNKEHVSDFLARRGEAWEKLQKALEGLKHPKLILSAEVGYAPGMADWPELEQLCYAGTKLLLVEPPMSLWNDEMFRQLYAIEGRRGITPIIAHVDRYFGLQPKDRIEQLLDMGFSLQVSTESLLRPVGRRKALKLLTVHGAVPVSDCHNTGSRPPNWEAAIRVMTKKLGSKADAILQRADEFLNWA